MDYDIESDVIAVMQQKKNRRVRPGILLLIVCLIFSIFGSVLAFADDAGGAPEAEVAAAPAVTPEPEAAEEPEPAPPAEPEPEVTSEPEPEVTAEP